MLILTFYEASAAARGTKNKGGKMEDPSQKRINVCVRYKFK